MTQDLADVEEDKSGGAADVATLVAGPEESLYLLRRQAPIKSS